MTGGEISATPATITEEFKPEVVAEPHHLQRHHLHRQVRAMRQLNQN